VTAQADGSAADGAVGHSERVITDPTVEATA